MKNSKSGNSRPKAAHLVSVNSMPSNAVSQIATSDYRLHLVMDKESYAKLLWLKANLEASSESEVIRRALQAYEIFEPEDAYQKEGVRNGINTCIKTEASEHLYVRIPSRIKEKLDDERETSGLSYGEQVRQALRLLMQFTRERQSVLQYVKGAGSCDDDTGEDIQDHLCCKSVKEHGDVKRYHRILATC